MLRLLENTNNLRLQVNLPHLCTCQHHQLFPSTSLAPLFCNQSFGADHQNSMTSDPSRVKDDQTAAGWPTQLDSAGTHTGRTRKTLTSRWQYKSAQHSCQCAVLHQSADVPLTEQLHASQAAFKGTRPPQTVSPRCGPLTGENRCVCACVCLCVKTMGYWHANKKQVDSN